MKKLIFVLLIAIQAQAQDFDFSCFECNESLSISCEDQLIAYNIPFTEPNAEGWVLYRYVGYTIKITSLDERFYYAAEYRHINKFNTYVRWYPNAEDYGPWQVRWCPHACGTSPSSTASSAFEFANNN